MSQDTFRPTSTAASRGRGRPAGRALAALLLAAVTVAGLSFAATGAVVAQSDDPLEPNDGIDAATAVTGGDEYSDLSITADDSDYFAIDLDAGESVTFQTSFSHANGDIDVTLYDENGETLDRSLSVSDGESVDFAAGESQTVYLEVYGYAGATNTYDLSVDVSEVSDGDDLRSISVGETAQGEIDTLDPDRYRGNYEPVTFQGSAGDVVTVEMTSAEGDTFLGLLGPDGEPVASDDDGGSGLNSRMGSVTLPDDGEYTIVATSYDSDATFSYELSVTQEGSTDTDLRSIVYGETESGVIDSSDPTGHRGNYEPVTFQGSEGDTVTIDMSSENGDTYLILLGPNGEELTSDDDGASGLNSRIRAYTLPESGEYTIVATSYSRSATFQYELSVEDLSGGDFDDLRSISMGEAAEGEVDPTDPEGYRGFYEPVTFYGEEGDLVSINMSTTDSTAYERDTYLILLGPNGEVLARDDDGGSQFNSRIDTFRLPDDGEYTIVATTYSDDATFEYRLSLGQVTVDSDGDDLRSVSVGETAQGEIDGGDPHGYRGFYEPVEFEGTAGDVVTVDMSVENSQIGDRDTYLILLGPNGEELVRDDDSGSQYNSRISSFRLPENGEYTIVATSYGEDATFEYELSVQESSSAGVGSDLRAIGYGETAEGQIDQADPNRYRGYYEPVNFQGSAGDVVTVDMTSQDGDTFLGLLGPNGEPVASDDDGGSGLNSRMESVQLPADGQYTIVATSFDSEATFDYELSLEREGQESLDGTDVRSIGYGATVQGEIDRADPRGYRGNYEPVTFHGSAGDVITVEMGTQNSEAYTRDTYLVLLGPDGQELTRNDDGGQDFNSTISGYRLPEDGEYTIVATSYGDQATFEYDLGLTLDSGAATDDLSLDATASQSVRGGNATVAFELENTGDESQGVILEAGPSVSSLPGNWTVTARDDDGGTWRDSRGVWLFEDLGPGDTVEPTVTASPPAEVNGTYTFAVRAQTNEGVVTDTVTVTFREQTVATAVDGDDDGQIDDGEILNAIESWRTDEPLPGTDTRISDQQILELTELWQEGESYR